MPVITVTIDQLPPRRKKIPMVPANPFRRAWEAFSAKHRARREAACLREAERWLCLRRLGANWQREAERAAFETLRKDLTL